MLHKEKNFFSSASTKFFCFNFLFNLIGFLACVLSLVFFININHAIDHAIDHFSCNHEQTQNWFKRICLLDVLKSLNLINKLIESHNVVNMNYNFFFFKLILWWLIIEKHHFLGFWNCEYFYWKICIKSFVHRSLVEDHHL